MKFSEQLKSGVILDNPVFMQTIGYRRSHLLQYRYFRDAQNYPG